MNVTATKITTIADAHLAIESTMRDGFEARCTLDQLYRWEHSPSRTQLFWIYLQDVPSFVSVHFVRHAAVGQQHFVQSNREDRGGAGDGVVNRTTPVNHRMLLNAQHLIDISRRRLCYQASKETRFAWQEVRAAISGIDSDLAKYMVQNCVYRGGYCCEPRPCGKYHVKQYNPEVIFEQICAESDRAKEALTWKDLVYQIADSLHCLPSSSPDGNSHLFRVIAELKADAGIGG